jgi:fluoride exporter
VTAWLLVALGGFLGANLRYATSLWAARRYGTAFPVGTLVVNVAGSLLIGVVLGAVTAPFDDPDLRLLAVTGFLGALTTFSTFAWETVALARAGWARAAMNVGVSLVLGLAGVVAGLAIADAIAGLAGGR